MAYTPSIIEHIPLIDRFNEALHVMDLAVMRGQTFIVADLFTNVEWKRIPIGSRSRLGALILFHVQGELSDKYKALEKLSKGQQIYQKL